MGYTHGWLQGLHFYLIVCWMHLTFMQDTFTDNNYRLYFGLTLDVLMRPWEKFLLGFKFTELGAIRFDRDLRSITTYLSSQTTFGDAREKFTRLQQMSTLLNLDSVSLQVKESLTRY